MDFNNIILSRKERFLLFALRFTKRMPGNFFGKSLKTFLQNNFIYSNHLPERDELGNFLPDGTYRISETGIRYRIYVHRERSRRVFTPIVVSAITSTMLYILQQLLLPEVSVWLRGLF